MKYKIGIFGSSAGGMNKVLPIAHALGDALSEHDVILITGAANGLPYEVVKAASNKRKMEVQGFSAAPNHEAELFLTPEQDHTIYTKYIYVPENYEFSKSTEISRKYRNISSTATCDAGIIISGRWGTMNEFTNLHDFGKVIGVLTGTDGIADQLPGLYKKITKPSKALVLFDNSPEVLVKNIIGELDRRLKQ